MGWRIIEINKNSNIKLFLNNLIILGEVNISIPINDIDVIMFTNNRINVSINLINKLCEENVCIFFCDEKYLPSSMVFPIVGNLLTLKIFNNQINWSNDFKGNVWQKIIRLKCLNQFLFLKHLNLFDLEEENLILTYIENIEFNDSTNREGHISKIYWHKLFGVSFNRTNDNLQINKLLNYGYTIINGMVARSIIKKGLDCRIGIFHKSVWNQFALSSDLIEPFRVVIDILVVELLRRNLIENSLGILTNEIKEVCLDFVANFKLKINGLYQQLNNAIDEFVDSLINENIFNIEIEYPYDIDVIEDENENSNFFEEESV